MWGLTNPSSRPSTPSRSRGGSPTRPRARRRRGSVPKHGDIKRPRKRPASARRRSPTRAQSVSPTPLATPGDGSVVSGGDGGDVWTFAFDVAAGRNTFWGNTAAITSGDAHPPVIHPAPRKARGGGTPRAKSAKPADAGTRTRSGGAGTSAATTSAGTTATRSGAAAGGASGGSSTAGGNTEAAHQPVASEANGSASEVEPAAQGVVETAREAPSDTSKLQDGSAAAQSASTRLEPEDNAGGNTPAGSPPRSPEPQHAANANTVQPTSHSASTSAGAGAGTGAGATLRQPVADAGRTRTAPDGGWPAHTISEKLAPRPREPRSRDGDAIEEEGAGSGLAAHSKPASARARGRRASPVMMAGAPPRALLRALKSGEGIPSVSAGQAAPRIGLGTATATADGNDGAIECVAVAASTDVGVGVGDGDRSRAGRWKLSHQGSGRRRPRTGRSFRRVASPTKRLDDDGNAPSPTVIPFSPGQGLDDGQVAGHGDHPNSDTHAAATTTPTATGAVSGKPSEDDRTRSGPQRKHVQFDVASEGGMHSGGGGSTDTVARRPITGQFLTRREASFRRRPQEAPTFSREPRAGSSNLHVASLPLASPVRRVAAAHASDDKTDSIIKAGPARQQDDSTAAAAAVLVDVSNTQQRPPSPLLVASKSFRHPDRERQAPAPMRVGVGPFHRGDASPSPPPEPLDTSRSHHGMWTTVAQHPTPTQRPSTAVPSSRNERYSRAQQRWRGPDYLARVPPSRLTRDAGFPRDSPGVRMSGNRGQRTHPDMGDQAGPVPTPTRRGAPALGRTAAPARANTHRARAKYRAKWQRRMPPSLQPRQRFNKPMRPPSRQGLRVRARPASQARQRRVVWRKEGDVGGEGSRATDGVPVALKSPRQPTSLALVPGMLEHGGARPSSPVRQTLPQVHPETLPTQPQPQPRQESNQAGGTVAVSAGTNVHADKPLAAEVSPRPGQQGSRPHGTVVQMTMPQATPLVWQDKAVNGMVSTSPIANASHPASRGRGTHTSQQQQSPGVVVDTSAWSPSVPWDGIAAMPMAPPPVAVSPRYRGSEPLPTELATESARETPTARANSPRHTHRVTRSSRSRRAAGADAQPGQVPASQGRPSSSRVRGWGYVDLVGHRTPSGSLPPDLATRREPASAPHEIGVEEQPHWESSVHARLTTPLFSGSAAGLGTWDSSGVYGGARPPTASPRASSPRAEEPPAHANAAGSPSLAPAAGPAVEEPGAPMMPEVVSGASRGEPQTKAAPRNVSTTAVTPVPVEANAATSLHEPWAVAEHKVPLLQVDGVGTAAKRQHRGTDHWKRQRRSSQPLPDPHAGHLDAAAPAQKRAYVRSFVGKPGKRRGGDVAALGVFGRGARRTGLASRASHASRVVDAPQARPRRRSAAASVRASALRRPSAAAVVNRRARAAAQRGRAVTTVYRAPHLVVSSGVGSF